MGQFYMFKSADNYTVENVKKKTFIPCHLNHFVKKRLMLKVCKTREKVQSLTTLKQSNIILKNKKRHGTIGISIFSIYIINMFYSELYFN